jgi:hypothetical protein
VSGVFDDQSHPSKRRQLAIARQVWTNLDSLTAPEVARRMGYVEEALAGLPVPTLSRDERAAIEAAAARGPEQP